MNTLASFYQEMFRYSIAPLLFAGAVAACFALTGNRREHEHAAGMPRHELAALTGILFAPPLFFAVAGFWQLANYSPRYGLLCVIGAAGVMSWLLARITQGRARVAGAFAIALGVWIAGARFREAQADRRPPVDQVESFHKVLLDALREGLPVLVAQPHIFLQADLYFPPALLQRAYFVTDPETDRGYVGQQMVDQLQMVLSQRFPLHSHVVLWGAFRRNRRFLLHTGSGYDQWIFDRLLREGWHITVRARNATEAVYEVNGPEI
jgi:hypothetical protein